MKKLISNQNSANLAMTVFNAILRIPGNKIVTIVYPDELGVLEVDINAEGHIGYAPQHRTALLSALKRGIKTSAGLIIRQFIPGSEEFTVTPNGKTLLIPWKAIYGAQLSQGSFTPLDGESVEIACTTCVDTGKRIKPEDKVIYKDFAEWLQSAASNTAK